jgi:hypothetical protein
MNPRINIFLNIQGPHITKIVQTKLGHSQQRNTHKIITTILEAILVINLNILQKPAKLPSVHYSPIPRI